MIAVGWLAFALFAAHTAKYAVLIQRFNIFYIFYILFGSRVLSKCRINTAFVHCAVNGLLELNLLLLSGLLAELFFPFE